MIPKIILLGSLLFLHIPLIAQDASRKVDMADTFRSNGKIYVVVAVLVTIFLGIIIYLIRLDKKITALEKADRTSIS